MRETYQPNKVNYFTALILLMSEFDKLVNSPINLSICQNYIEIGLDGGDSGMDRARIRKIHSDPSRSWGKLRNLALGDATSTTLVRRWGPRKKESWHDKIVCKFKIRIEKKS
jgi:hypothetical protein